MRPPNNAAAPTPEELFARLAPRDRDVVSALIDFYWLHEKDVAPQIQMSVHNFRARRQNAYRVLGIDSRPALIFIYREIATRAHGGKTPT